MLKAVLTGRIPFRTHLRECRECRDLFAFLSDTAYLKMIRAEQPSDELLARCARAPLIEAARHPARTERGRVISDSWRGLSAVVVRDAATGIERRLRLASRNLVLDLVAERRADAWSFFARVYDRDRVASADYVLEAGRRRLTAGPRDMYAWDAKRPPRSIHLVSAAVRIRFDRIDWSAAD